MNIHGGATNHSGYMFNGNPSFQGQHIHFNAPQTTGLKILILASTMEAGPYQCLKDLYSSDPSAEKARLETAEDRLVPDSYTWILQDSAFLEWLHGDGSKVLRLVGGPGKGKTMTMIGLTNYLAENINSEPKPSAISYFFCRATDDRLSDATLVLRGLLHYLLSQEPNQTLIRYIKEKHDKCGANIFDGPSNNFILQKVLIDILQDDNFQQFYLVVDALDECNAGLNDLLNLIKLTTTKSPKIKWLVSSRSNIDIDGFFRVFGDHLSISMESHKPEVDSGIKAYIREKVSNLCLRNKYTPDQMDKISQELNKKAEGTYLWVHLACKVLEKCRGSKALAALKDIPSGLEAIYYRMVQSLRMQNESFGDLAICSLILATVTIATRPLQLQELLAITSPSEAGEDLEELVQRITECGSFLSLQGETIYFIHQSAKDFLEQQAGLGASIIPESLLAYHEIIGRNCLRLFRESLREDICDLRYPGFLVSDLSEDHKALISHLEYACCSWATHIKAVAKAGRDDQINDVLEDFLQHDLLHWIEALSLLERVPEGTNQVTCLEETYNDLELCAKLEDVKRFLLENQPCLTTAPLQVYSGALIFSPDRSWVKTSYMSRIPTWINPPPMIDDLWEGCLQDIRNVTGTVSFLAISPDSRLLAMVNREHLLSKVVIFDIATGAQLATVDWPLDPTYSNKYAFGYIDCIRFTEDSSKLLVASWVGSKPALTTLHISSTTWTTRFHPVNLHEVAPGSWSSKAYILPDATKGIWYNEKNLMFCGITSTGEFASPRILGGESITISMSNISPDGRYFAFFNMPLNEIQIYDIRTGACLCKFSREFHSPETWIRCEELGSGNTDRIFCGRICFSHTGEVIATAHSDDKVILRSVYNGDCQKIIDIPQNVTGVYLSRSGRRLICIFRPSPYRLQQLWVYDLHNNSVELETEGISLDTYNDGQFLLSYSAQGAEPQLVLWDPDFPGISLHLSGFQKLGPATGTSTDGKVLAKSFQNGQIKVFDINDSWQKKYPNQDRKLYPLPILSKDLGIGVQSDNLAERFIRHERSVESVVFSPDGAKVASGSGSSLVIWHPTTLAEERRICLQQETICPNTIALTFSNDGNKLAAVFRAFGPTPFRDKINFGIWDVAGTPICESGMVFESKYIAGPESFTALALSPDNGLLLGFFNSGISESSNVWHWSIRDKSYHTVNIPFYDKKEIHIITRARFSNSGNIVVFAFVTHSPRRGIALYKPESGTTISQFILESLWGCEISFSQDDTGIEVGGRVFKISNDGRKLSLVKDSPVSISRAYMHGNWLGMDTHNLVYLPSRYLPHQISSYAWSEDGVFAGGCTSGNTYTLGFNKQAIDSLLVGFVGQRP
ncbi:hypothetical protein TWF281_005346 [Arthrobotrys megalospora]